MESSNLLSLVNVAKEAAKNAGKKLFEEFQRPQEVLLSKGRDIKLAVDEIAEKIIIDYLKEVEVDKILVGCRFSVLEEELPLI